MADFLSVKDRSMLMSRVRNRGTAPERYVRRSVWAAGFRYRLNVRKLPSAPDLLLPRYRTAVLVQGCFWHGHDCRKGRTRPASNTAFWNQKLDRTVARDTENQARLRELGWKVFIIWACELQSGTAGLIDYLNTRRGEFGVR